MARTKKTETKVEKEIVKEIVKEPVVYVEKEEKVVLLFVGEVRDGTVVDLGNELGKINGSFNTIDINKKDFIQKRSLVMDKMLKKKKLIVLSGLTEDEKKRYGISYDEKEILTVDLRHNILNLPLEKLENIYSDLCEEHKKVVATIFIDAYGRKNPLVTQDKVKALNKISKEVDKDGLFTPILRDMGEKLGDE